MAFFIEALYEAGNSSFLSNIRHNEHFSLRGKMSLYQLHQGD